MTVRSRVRPTMHTPGRDFVSWVVLLSLLCKANAWEEGAEAKLAIEFPQNESTFAADERPRFIISDRAGKQWSEESRILFQIRSLDAEAHQPVNLSAEYAIHDIFAMNAELNDDEQRVSSEIMVGALTEPGKYVAHVVVTLVKGQNEDEKIQRTLVWSDCVIFSIEIPCSDTQAGARSSLPISGGGGEVDGMPQNSGIFFDNPARNMHHFSVDEPLYATVRVEGNFDVEAGALANFYLSGAHFAHKYVATSSNAKSLFSRLPNPLSLN